MTQPQASKHLRVSDIRPVRPRAWQRLYDLTLRAAAGPRMWAIRAVLERELDRLDEYVQELKAAKQEGPQAGHDQ
jgi:hypothetical protein